MVLEFPVQPLGAWLSQHAPVFAALAVLLGFLGLLAGFVIGAQRAGPRFAFQSVAQGISQGIRDLGDFSPRRTIALARLAVKESLRSYVLVVPLVFLLILAFAGWFLDDRGDNPTRLYVSFVLKIVGFLTLLMAVFLTAFSLPNDLKNKTIFTIVTKPVRGWEIVLGRILGFGFVGTLVILAMGLVSYLWIVGSLSHRHEVLESQVQADPEVKSDQMVTGTTTRTNQHRHEFSVRIPGEGQTTAVRGHYHPVTVTGTGDAMKVTLGPARGALQARVPVYGSLQFLDRTGQPVAKGINVGKEWTYRGYIEGNSLCAGIFHFSGLESRDFPDGLPLEMTIRVFRTYKGDIERGIRGNLVLRNPASNNPQTWAQAIKDVDVARESEPLTFFASDLTPESINIARRIEARMPDGSLREVDLFESLVHNGELEIVVQCDERAQYFGMAVTDLYLRSADRSFTVNFLKTSFTLWLRMMIVVAFGVMFSTFLTGPIAMLATVTVMVLGFFAQSITDVAMGKTPGGGPVESLIRIFRQDNMISELDLGEVAKFLIRLVDNIALLMMRAVSSIMPNFGDFAERGGIETSRFVAYGFDIPPALLWQHALVAMCYVILCTIAGYYLLKSKEVAA